MNNELREVLGRALQQKRRELSRDEHGKPYEGTWDEVIELAKERDRQCAEAVVECYLVMLSALDASMAFEADMQRIAKGSER